MKPIKQSVINTFNRVGIDYKTMLMDTKLVTIGNRFGGGACETTRLIAECIEWVYSTSNDYELGIRDIKISDFDRVRYFVLEQDANAYQTCLD